MNLILFGAPGSGKGTQSEKLVQQKKLSHISTGDILRQAISDNTALGQKAKGFMDRGELVPDDVVIGIIGESLEDVTQGFILDGFPRTEKQAEALSKMTEEMGKAIDAAIFLEVPEDLLKDRLTGRRVCRNCRTVFHVRQNPPQEQGVCDKCGGELYQRDDDKEEVIGERLRAYFENTEPLRTYYSKKGLLKVVDGSRSASEVFQNIMTVIA